MNQFLKASIFATTLITTSAFAAPNPEAIDPVPAPSVFRVTLHKMENGEKKSSQTITATNGSSASTFTIANNKTFERSFYNPELLDNGKVMVRLHQCSGTVTEEQLQNLSSVDCRPELMNRLNFEASLSKSTIVEANGPNGEKQEYFIFVEKVAGTTESTTL